MKVIDPFLDGEGVWQGDSPGTMRKRFQCFGIKNSVDFCSNTSLLKLENTMLAMTKRC